MSQMRLFDSPCQNRAVTIPGASLVLAICVFLTGQLTNNDDESAKVEAEAGPCHDWERYVQLCSRCTIQNQRHCHHERSKNQAVHSFAP